MFLSLLPLLCAKVMSATENEYVLQWLPPSAVHHKHAWSQQSSIPHPLCLSPQTFSASVLSSKWSLPNDSQDLPCLHSVVLPLDSSTCHYSHFQNLALSSNKWTKFLKFSMTVPSFSLSSIWFYSSPSNFHHDLPSTFYSIFSPLSNKHPGFFFKFSNIPLLLQ